MLIEAGATGDARRNRPPPEARKLPAEANDELQRILETYERLKASAPGQHAGADREIDCIKGRLKADDVKWSDLGEAELCTIELVGDADVRARLASWRRRMHEIIGDARYASYIATAPDPNAATTSSPMLRADLAECISTVNYFYGAYGVAASSRALVTMSLLWWAAAVLCVLGALALLIPQAPRFHIVLPGTALEYLLATSAAAVVGSVVSVQRRLQNPKVDVDPFYRYIQTNADQLGIAVVSVLFGAILGFAIYALLVSGLIEGPAFPKFDPNTGIPSGPKQIALLIVYGFLAGFAEQLVPDALTRIAARTLGGIVGAPATSPPRGADKENA
ncbi:MAG: hypothetical protein NVSMB19_12840 [Vulcanimicrobiaceae bacterium]